MSEICLSTPSKATLALAEQYYQEALALQKQEQYTDAYILLEKAYAIYLKNGKENEPVVGEVLSLIGNCAFYTDNYEETIRYKKQAYHIFAAVLGDKSERTLSCLLDLAPTFIRLAKPDQALDCLNKIVAIKGASAEVATQQNADMNFHFGVLYRKTGDYGQAVLYFQKGIHLLKSLPEPSPFISTYYNSLALCYQKIGDYEQAIHYYKKSLREGLKQYGEYHSYIAGVYHNLGHTYRQLGNYAKALAFLEKGLSISIKIYGETSHYTASSYIGVAQTYNDLNDFEQALHYFQKAKSVFFQLYGAEHPRLAYSYYNIAIHYRSQQDYHLALSYCQKGLRALISSYDMTDPFKNPELPHKNHEQYIQLLSCKASIFYKLHLENPTSSKHLLAALDAINLTMPAIGKKRQSYQSDTSKLALAEHFRKLCPLGITIAHTAWQKTKEFAYLENAFSFAEKAKASLLRGAMQESLAKATAAIPVALLEKEKGLKTKLNQLDKTIQKKSAKKNQPIKDTDALQTQFLSYQQQYAQLIAQYEKNYPDYFELKYQTQTATIAQTQALLKSGELLIQYCLGEQGKLFIFAISATQAHLEQVNIEEDLQQTINNFERILMIGNIDRYIQLASQLYQWLIAPIEPYLNEVNKLLLIPDNFLQYLPFDALIRPLDIQIDEFSELPYLIKTYDIQYHYGATLICYARQTKKSKTKATKEEFLGVAPITFGTKPSASSGYVLKSSRKGREIILKSGATQQMALQDLAATETEVKTVFNLFEQQQKDALALFYDMASKENLLKYIEQYKYILLSTHGFTDTQRAALSGLELYDVTQGMTSTENVKLYISDILHLDLNAELVVLSSCESGVGKLQKGEGMLALHRAFLYAGARNIIYALFKVPQDTTSELIQTLFHHILTGDDYAHALRKAKLQLINNELMEPIDWAGFALMGA